MIGGAIRGAVRTPVVWCAVSAVVLTGCIGLDEPEDEQDEAAGEEQADDQAPEEDSGDNIDDDSGDGDDADSDSEGNADASSDVNTVVSFCEDDPEVTDVDEARILEGGLMTGGEPEDIPMPYLDQLDDDADFVAPSQDGPAEEVPAPEFSALICDEDADYEARSAVLSQWFEFYYYSELVIDDELLQQLIADECSECANASQEIRSFARDGMWVESEPLTGRFHTWQTIEDPDRPTAVVETTGPAFTVYDTEGEVESGGSTDFARGYIFDYVDDVGHWQLVGLRDASVGDDAFGGPQDEGTEPSDEADAADVETPEMPAEAEEESPEGALAAHDHWLESLDYALITGDSDPVAAMHHPNNEELREFYSAYVEAYDDGGHVEMDGDSEFRDVEVFVEDVETEGAAIITGELHEPPRQVFDSGGEWLVTPEHLDGEPVIYAFMYNDDVGHWQLLEAEVADADEFFDEAGTPDAEPDLTR